MTHNHSLYHTDAVGASGKITLPVADSFPIQASLSNGVGDGFAKVRVENFKHLDYLSIGLMETVVVSSFDEKTGTHSTRCSVLIEDLNILHSLRCERIVMNLTSSQPEKAEVGNGAFALHGTHFDNLTFGGDKIDLKFIGELLRPSTWEDFRTMFPKSDFEHHKESVKKESKDHKKGDVLGFNPISQNTLTAQAIYPKKNDSFTHHGVYGVSLVTFPELPAGIERTPTGHGFAIPHFGKIYPAQYYVAKGSRRVSMLHVELGCAVEGKGDFATGGANGMPLPGNG
jgi:hypothetical protein